MTTPRFGIVVTTINGGEFLSAYLHNLRSHGHLADTRLYVVGDRKTPPACRAAADAARRAGLDCLYLGVEEQLTFLRDFPEIDGIVPWNTDNRRNVGFLMALRDGVETLITIDDDNLPANGEDFVGGHAVTGQTLHATEFSAASGWFNLFDAVEHTPNVAVWPRGFPYRLRRPDEITSRPASALVHVNAGLWLGDPDVDAITRIAIHPDVTRVTSSRGLLAGGTYSPINTQNTSIARAAVAAYYYVLMHEPMHGSRLNRFGDIWSGYFVQRCAKSLGAAVAFGPPPVAQVRNDHDLFVDLREEFWGIVLTEHLSKWITEVRLQGSDYPTVYGSLADALAQYVRTLEHPAVNHEVVAYFEKIRTNMLCWLEGVHRVLR